MRHNTLSISVERRAIPDRAEQVGFTLNKIPMPPSVNNLLNNVDEGGRKRTDRYRSWTNAAGWTAMAQHPQRVRGPVTIHMTFEDGGSKADIDNLAKAPIDLLVSLRLIDADDASVVRKVTLEWGKVEGCQIKVEPARAA